MKGGKKGGKRVGKRGRERGRGTFCGVVGGERSNCMVNRKHMEDFPRLFPPISAS